VVYNYAVSLLREQKFAAATPALRRVTRERPDFAGGWQALASCLRARGRHGQAVEAYQKALELKPDPKLAYNLGVTAGKAGRWDTAIAAYDQALTLAPGATEPAYNRAVALMRAGRLEEAAGAFAAYRETDPDHYRAALNHGVTLYRLGRYEEAVDVYNYVLELEETAQAWDNLGLAYQELGKEERAQACFKEAEKLRGGS
jgi:tetratricopeptide (TPR) repeat protein